MFSLFLLLNSFANLQHDFDFGEDVASSLREQCSFPWFYYVQHYTLCVTFFQASQQRNQPSLATALGRSVCLRLFFPHFSCAGALRSKVLVWQGVTIGIIGIAEQVFIYLYNRAKDTNAI